AEQHLSVLRSAILRALAQVDPWPGRVHPHLVLAIRNQVGLPAQLRNPETVVGIGREQLEEGRRWMLRVTDRNVQFICRNNAEIWISELPPILMADDRDIYGASGLGSVLDGVNHTRRRQKQHRDDQNWNDSPCQLDLCTSIHLSRLSMGISRFATE